MTSGKGTHPRLEASRQVLAWLRPRAARLAILFVGVLGPLWLFGGLGSEIREKEGFFWDPPILHALHAHANRTLDVLALAASHAGLFGVIVVDVLLFGVLLWRGRVRSALFFAAAVGGATVLCVLGKHFYGRVRPALWPSLAPEKTFSFPSGHAMGSMALGVAVVALLWHRRTLRVPVTAGAALFVLAVGLSRVYLGVHFPSDIVAGWAASVMWVLGAHLLFFGVKASAAPSSSDRAR